MTCANCGAQVVGGVKALDDDGDVATVCDSQCRFELEEGND